MQKEISLVLSGGGARGIAHIGVIEVLLDKGFKIKNIAGTSMGAMVGGMYAGGGLEAFKDWLVNADIKEVIKMLDFSLKLPGLIKGEKIMHKVESFLKVKNIEDLPVFYTAIATDLNAKKGIHFTSGKLSFAIRASIAIPTIFTPLFVDDQILVDGGLVNNIPVDQVYDKGYPVIAVCVNADVPLSEEEKNIMDKESELQHAAKLQKLRNILSHHIKSWHSNDRNTFGYAELLDRAIHLMIGRTSHFLIEKNPPDLLINISRDLCGTFDFLKAEKIIEAGRLVAERSLQNIEGF